MFSTESCQTPLFDMGKVIEQVLGDLLNGWDVDCFL
jgi:hypothetical protein